MALRARTPENTCLYAVGDIHGRLDLLTRLLARIEEEAAARPTLDNKLIFLGDYIDRGVDSRGVIERLLKPFAGGISPVFLRGNHEDILLRFMEGALGIAPLWLRSGGAAAVASYGINPYSLQNAGKLEALRADLLKNFPEDHRSFLDNTLYAVTFGDYYFVHAGVRPGVKLPQQKPEDQMWIREDFLNYPKGMGKMIVHGHTIRPEPEVKPNRIGIDTGAYATGHLTCLVMEGTERRFFST